MRMDHPAHFDAMHLSRNFLEKAGSDAMALAILAYLNGGDTQHAAILAREAASDAERNSYSDLQGLAAVALEKCGEIPSALQHWDSALAGPGSKMKWIESALRFAWRAGTDEALSAGERWQKIIESLYSEVPTLQFLRELDQHGWKGKGSLGIKNGKLLGWLWLDTEEKPSLEIDESIRNEFNLILRAQGEIGGKRLYIVNEEAPQKECFLVIKDGSGKPVQGCPIFFSQPALVQSERKQDKRTTILIPVFGDREATLACIGSVLASRKKNRTATEILAIWDCGEDQTLLADLRKLAKRQKIRLIENQRNMGFLASVNHAMSMIKSGHILLLNADTLVHGNWVDRMVAIGEKKNAATVTALSNQAELMSYPSKEEPGIIESLSQTRIMDEAAATLDSEEAAQIVPTGIGFCMLITRRALTRIGGLDGNMLFRGYGEEVEFCLRARDAGMINYGAFNVFVAHRGERSFGQAKKMLAHQNNVVINEKYPEHRQEYRVFMAQDARKQVRQKISFELIKHLGDFDCLELRPWISRNLLPWKREKDPLKDEKSAVLFIKTGPRPEALLRLRAELPVTDMYFNLSEDQDSLNTALGSISFRKVLSYGLGEAALQQAHKAGIREYADVEGAPLERIPIMLGQAGKVLVAPPAGQAAWRQLCGVARANPETGFFVFNLDRLWDGAPRPANIHAVEEPIDWRKMNTEIFLIMDRFCDASSWRKVLQQDGASSLKFCTVALDG